MEAFILIMWMETGKTSAIQTQEFNSRETCEQAIAKVEETGAWGSFLRMVCVPK